MNEITAEMFWLIFQIKDTKASEIMDVYEAKLSSLQVRCKDLISRYILLQFSFEEWNTEYFF